MHMLAARGLGSIFSRSTVRLVVSSVVVIVIKYKTILHRFAISQGFRGVSRLKIT